MNNRNKVEKKIDDAKTFVKEVTPDGEKIKFKAKQAGDVIGEVVSDVKIHTKDKMKTIDDKMNSLDKELGKAIESYNASYTSMNDTGVQLYIERMRSLDILNNIEQLINSIANHPKTFDADFCEMKTQKQKFNDTCEFAKEQLIAAKKSAEGAGAGIAAGAVVACMAPSTAIWIATTFGTASTGVAISTLSGAAASNAALAWLGGGALAMGGDGVAGGGALLALAGPIGWGIAGATILTAIVLFASKKDKLNKRKNEEIISIKTNTKSIKETNAILSVLLDKTGSLRKKINELYLECIPTFGQSFNCLSENQQTQLEVLVNNAKALAALLEKNKY